MRNLLILMMLLFLLEGCSFQEAPNKSQFETTSAFSSYTKNFLSDNSALAKNDLKRAIEHAKKSADFDALARIYLGECALDISVGLLNSCQKYRDIEALNKDDTLNAYYSLIRKKIKKDDIVTLPQIYQEFAKYMITEDFTNAYNEILGMERVNSQLIAASLIANSLDKKQIEHIIKLASFYGYKKSILFWLEKLKIATKERTEKEKVSKKIAILKSKI